MTYQSWITVLNRAMEEARWTTPDLPKRCSLCWIISDDVAKDIMQDIGFVLNQPTVSCDKAMENQLMGIPAYEAKEPGTLKLCIVIKDLSPGRLLS